MSFQGGGPGNGAACKCSVRLVASPWGPDHVDPRSPARLAGAWLPGLRGHTPPWWCSPDRGIFPGASVTSPGEHGQAKAAPLRALRIEIANRHMRTGLISNQRNTEQTAPCELVTQDSSCVARCDLRTQGTQERSHLFVPPLTRCPKERGVDTDCTQCVIIALLTIRKSETYLSTQVPGSD